MKKIAFGFCPAGRSFQAWLVLLLVTLGRASAQTASAPVEEKEKEKAIALETFTVTGSNIKMTAAEADKTELPIEFISDTKFKLTSGESVGDLMRNQPTVVGNVSSQFTDEAQGGVSNVNLRGIGARYTLVVVDGRRMGGEGQPDIGTVPSEAIQRVEILKSGASAIYGSDAVAGVVNIKLKDRFEGLELVTSYGNTTNRDASYKKTALLFGLGRDKFKLVGSIGWEDRNAIDKNDRTLTATRDYRSVGGIDRRTATRGALDRITLPGNVFLTLDTTRVSVGRTGTTAADYRTFSTETDTYNNNELGTAPGFERYNAHWNASYEILGKNLVAFAQGYWDTHEQTFRPKEPRALVSVPATNPYNPFGVAVTVDYLIGEVPPVEEIWDIDEMQSAFGLRGELKKFDYSVAFSRYSRNGYESWINDFPTSLLQAAVNRTDATAFNPFGYWANNATQLAGLSIPKHYTQKNQTDILDAKLSGDLFELPNGPVRFAAGAEKREITFSTDPDQAWRTLPSNIFNDVRSPSSGGRDVKAYYAEVRVPVYRSNRSALLESVDVSGAGRHEKYNDFGGATVGQATLRIGALDDTLVLRGSWAQGFKAPTVQNLSANQITSTPSGLFDPVRNSVGVINLITGGNPNLGPEEADTYNFGAIYSPKQLKGLTVKADYWIINISNIIATPAAQAILNGTSPGGSIISRDPVTLVPTVDGRTANGGDLNASGIDIGASYTLRTGSLGKFTFDLGSTYMLEFENIAGPTKFDFNGDYSATFGPVPRLRGVLGTLWEKGGWDSGLFLRYTGGIRESALPAPLAPTRVTEDTWTADLQVGYNFGNTSRFGGLLKNLRVYAGVENLWDEPLVFLASNADGWDRSLGDFRGRYVYVGVRKKL